MNAFQLLAALGLLAAPAARAADVKIGFVDFARALNEVEDGKVARAQIKKDFDQKQKSLNDMQADLKKAKDDFDKQAVVMAEGAKREKQADLDRRIMELQNRYMQMQQELSGKEREIMRGIVDKMTQVVHEIADAEGFTYVFEKNDAGLIHAPPANDLTNELVRKYNARFKGEVKKKAESGKKPESGKK